MTDSTFGPGPLPLAYLTMPPREFSVTTLPGSTAEFEFKHVPYEPQPGRGTIVGPALTGVVSQPAMGPPVNLAAQRLTVSMAATPEQIAELCAQGMMFLAQNYPAVYSETITAMTGPPRTSRTPSITCPRCRKTSFSRTDIVAGYCGNCHMFHDEMTDNKPGEEQPANLEPPAPV